MSSKIRTNTNPRQIIRLRKKQRIRKKIVLHMGTISRLVVYRSNQFIYAQIIDDLKGNTLAEANTREESFKSLGSKKNIEAAKKLGSLIGQRAIEKKVEKVLFDRNGYEYHGRIKALAESAREAGLKF
ncbi:MAG: 50S ribosomal protein L18 [Bdellovibrionales bacterium]|nr:50S ribosomal protein L18 [Pseudomonadota bacterium]MSP19037.1 50S ribosomal protein L18 [Bdellovibrionales bacterium]NQW45285.1 50S ribosomal protein L18 [Deltaproteobacteria bacterium]